jgi:hypothetical protein
MLPCRHTRISISRGGFRYSRLESTTPFIPLSLERSRTALLQAWTWIVGTVVMIVGVCLIYTGHPEAEPIAGIGSFIALFGMLVLRVRDACDLRSAGRNRRVSRQYHLLRRRGRGWQVGVDWENVLPPWFKVLSETAIPEEYATRVVDLLNHHCKYESPRMLAMARKFATPAQERALANA